MYPEATGKRADNRHYDSVNYLSEFYESYILPSFLRISYKSTMLKFGSCEPPDVVLGTGLGFSISTLCIVDC